MNKDQTMDSKKAISVLEITRMMFEMSLPSDDCDCDKDTLEAREDNEETIEAINEAIKALKREPSTDAISREEAVKVLRADPSFICTGDKTQAIIDISSLPPVTPERPKGEWEEYGHNLGDDYIPVGIRCSKCHIEPPKRDPSKDKSFMNYIKSDFCPSCGADMRGGSV